MQERGINYRMVKKLSPIILFTYNRLKHTIQTIEFLKKNKLSKKSDLIIFSDAAKTKNDEKSVEEVRNYLKTITGFKKIKIIQQKENLGLEKSIISGITQVINKYGKVIVLEDDILVSPYYLDYMNTALRIYESDNRIFSISGYSYPMSDKLPETFFLKQFSCQAWGTWKRTWKLFEPDGRKLLEQIKEKRKFNINNSYPFYRMLKNQVCGKLNSWAIRFNAVSFIRSGLNLYPKKSLIENIGFDSSGVHCTDSNWVQTKMFQNPIDVRRLELRQNEEVFKKLEKFFKRNRLVRIRGRIKRILNI